MHKDKKSDPYMSNSANGLPEDFTLSLALVDAIPVVLFCCSMILIALRFHSALFLIGAIASAFAGCGKVLWKIIIVAVQKNATWLAKQFRYLMSAGFLLMILALIVNCSHIQWHTLLVSLTAMPSVLFFIIGICGMILMFIFGAKLDKTDVKSNWIEQCTNLVAQLCFLLGIILL